MSFVGERFAAAGVAADSIICDRSSYTFRFSGATAFPAIFRDYYGPTVNANEAATSVGREEEVHAELGALFDAENRAADGRTETLATYLRVTVYR